MWVIPEATVKVNTSILWMFNFIIRILLFTLLEKHWNNLSPLGLSCVCESFFLCEIYNAFHFS